MILSYQKFQLSKMLQSRGFLGRLLGPVIKIGLPLIKNLLKPLAKRILIPLGLTAAASEDMKVVKSLEDSGILLKGSWLWF